MIKLLDLLENEILIPRRIKERKKNHAIVLTREIKQYIENGSKGNILMLDLTEPLPILRDLKKVDGNLDLRYLKSIPEGFSPTVKGYFYANNVKTPLPEGFNPTVGGALDLTHVPSIPKGFNPTVGGNLYLTNVTFVPKEFNPTVGGNLKFSGFVEIEKGWNPTNVSGNIYVGREMVSGVKRDMYK